MSTAQTVTGFDGDAQAGILHVAFSALQAEAGPGMRLASFSFELAGAQGCETAEVAVTCEKQTRSISFLALEARGAGELLFSARAVFVRTGA